MDEGSPTKNDAINGNNDRITKNNASASVSPPNDCAIDDNPNIYGPWLHVKKMPTVIWGKVEQTKVGT